MMRWSVQYEYIVDGKLYHGANIDARRSSVLVKYGRYPLEVMDGLQTLKTAWYNPADPSQTVLFRDGDGPI